MNEPVKIADASAVNIAMYVTEGEMAAKRVVHLMERRDRIAERLQFGVLALNGGSLIALIGALGGDGAAAAWLGFNPERVQQSAVAFVIGATAAAVSLVLEVNLAKVEAGHAEARFLTVTRLRALHEAPMTPENHERVGVAMKEYQALPLVGFQYSNPALWANALAGGAWLAGMAIPLFHALRF